MKGECNLKIFTKIIAVLTAAFIVIKVVILDTFAFAGASVIAAEALVALFGPLLVGAGICTQQQVDEMSWGDMQPIVSESLSGVNPAVDPISAINLLMAELTTNPKCEAARDVVLSATNASLKSLLTDKSRLEASTVEKVPTTSTNGYGCHIHYKGLRDSRDYRVYCQYAVLKNGYLAVYGDGYVIDENGKVTNFQSAGNYPSYGQAYAYPGNAYFTTTAYGDVRNLDGSKADTDDEYQPVVGSLAGLIISADMLNPDGTAIVDGVTYDPTEFVDYSKFNEQAIIDLLNQILDAINNSAVVDESNPTDEFVDDVSVSLDIEAINNFKVPSGIASVFPFCLPFDFVRGLQLLAVPPVAPVFEVPFTIPEFGMFPGFEDTVKLDFAEYSKYFEVGRWVQVIIFSIGLCFISFKVVKGVH